MSRTVFPFIAEDVSALARSLTREIEACGDTPGHVQMLNMLARSTGYRNFQHFRAQHEARNRLDREPAAPEPVDHLLVERTARHFDTQGRLTHWPAKASHRTLCFWVLWSRFPAGRGLPEKEVNELLRGNHLFGDPALLRRELCDGGFLARTPDGGEYRRREQRPPAEAVALIRHLGGLREDI